MVVRGKFSEWTNGWQPIDDAEEAVRLTAELTRELGQNVNHKLFGQQVEFLGKHTGDDDFVVALNATGEFAYLHLTWHEELDSNWPHTQSIYDEAALRKFLSEWSK